MSLPRTSTPSSGSTLTATAPATLTTFQRLNNEMMKVMPDASMEQVQTFLAIAKSPKCTQQQLVTSTNFTKARISRHVKLLVDLNLVAQDKDSVDQRRDVLTITSRGRLVADSLDEILKG